MASFDLAIPTVLKHEGGLVNHKSDPGGITNWGVSLRAAQGFGSLRFFDRDHDGDIDADDIRFMTVDEAKAIYREFYWKAIYEQIGNQGVATKVFDMAVNMGHKQAHKILQRAVVKCGKQCSADGVFGPGTLAAVNTIHPATLLAALRKKCEDFYFGLCEKNEKNCVFLDGWLARARS